MVHCSPQQPCMEIITDTVTKLKVVIEELKSISTYFHTSGVRRAQIQSLLTKNLAGGWEEEALLSALSEDGDSLKDIKL